MPERTVKHQPSFSFLKISRVLLRKHMHRQHEASPDEAMKEEQVVSAATCWHNRELSQFE